MRSSPQYRIRPASMPAALAPEDVGRLVKELALALREPAEAADFASLLPNHSAGPIVDANGELPQILKPRPDDTDLPQLSTWRVDPSGRANRLARLSEQLTSGVPRFVTGLAAAAILVVASLGAINSFASLNSSRDTQIAAISPEAVQTPTSPNSTELVKESKRMIERGNIAAARALLEPAAAAGEAAAVMALAETFDPNMLAAWGARGQTADPRAARKLYAKAHSAGIAGARQRLDALKEAP